MGNEANTIRPERKLREIPWNSSRTVFLFSARTSVFDPFEDAGEKVNRKSNELIEEFHEHFQEFAEGIVAEGREPNIESVDRNKVFQGWAIQKIAGLQLLVMDLIEWREREISRRN